MAALVGLKVTVPALFMVGERDTGLAMPGMEESIKAMPSLVPELRGVVRVRGAGHWLPQEQCEEFNTGLIAFLKTL